MAKRSILLTFAHGKRLSIEGKRLVDAVRKFKMIITRNDGSGETHAQLEAAEMQLRHALENLDAAMTGLIRQILE